MAPNRKNADAIQVAKYPQYMYRPALRIWHNKPGKAAESEVFLAEECYTKQALIEKYLAAHLHFFPHTLPTADDYHFQFGRAVPGTAEMKEESFQPDYA